MEVTEGTNREGHGILAEWRILGEQRTVTQESMHDWSGGFISKPCCKKMILHETEEGKTARHAQT